MSVAQLSGTSASAGRNKLLAIAGAALLLLATSLAVIRYTPGHLGTGLFGSSDANGGAGERSALANALAKTRLGADFLQMIGQRSPGERVAGELADTKGRKLARAAAPHQRALPKVRRAAALPESFVQPIFQSQPQAISAAPPLVPAIAELLPPPLAQTLPPILGSSPPGGGGGIISPPVIASPTPVTPTEVVPPVVTVTPPVPEPQTWLLMLAGFGAGGLSLRRRRARPTILRDPLAR